MLFDTWGGVLTPAQYAEFSLRYMAEIVAALTREAEGRRVPSIVFTKGGGAMAPENRSHRLRCRRRGLDHRPRQPRAGPSKTGSRCRAIWTRRRCSRSPEIAARRNVARAREFRRGQRARVQLGARDHARCRSRAGGGAGRDGAQLRGRLTLHGVRVRREPSARRSARGCRAQFIAQCAAQDLAHVGLRQLGAKIHVLRHLVARSGSRGNARSGLRP